MTVMFTRGENPLKADKLNSAFSERVARSGDTMQGRLNLFADPVAPFEAATKQYVDRFTSVGVPTGAYIGAAPPGNMLAPLWWDTNTGQLFIQYNDGSSTQWVSANSIDASSLAGSFLPLTGGSLSGPLLLAADPAVALGAATKQYVDGHAPVGGPYVPVSGGTLTGPLVLAADPLVPLSAATKQYVDTKPPLGGPFLPIAGGTVTGPTTFSGTGLALDVSTGTVRFRNPGITQPVVIARNTTAPSAYIGGTMLEVIGDQNSPVITIDAAGSATPFFSFRTSQGTIAAPTAQVGGARLGWINWSGHNGSGFTGAAASFGATSDGNWNGASTRVYLNWYTTAAGSTTQTERMRLTSTGELLTGGVTSGNGAKLKVHQGTVAPGATTAYNFCSEIDSITGTSGTQTTANVFQIVNDSSSTGQTTLVGLSYAFGGPAHNGSVSGLTTGISMTAPTTPAAGRWYMGHNIFMSTSYSAGGTDTGGINSRGTWYGLNLTPQLLSGATNWLELTSAEIDSAVATGASVARRVNLKLCLQSNHGVQGVSSDCMLELGLIKGATVGSRIGIAFGQIEGFFPIDNTNGVGIGHDYTALTQAPGTLFNPQLKTFIDASHINALTAQWLSPGASLDGSGNRTIGPAKLNWSAAGASLDVFGQVGGTPTILAGGVNATNGQIVTTGNGDLYTVTAVGGAVTALTVIVPATSRATGPVGGQIIQGDGLSGATCQIPWTNARTLSLQPGGGAIVSPLFINAVNDAAAASAGVVVGQLYRNGSVMMQRAA